MNRDTHAAQQKMPKLPGETLCHEVLDPFILLVVEVVKHWVVEVLA